MKKGDIWISAVLYMALGIIILTIVLAAGMPVIKNMKDKYTLTKTKEIMITLDDNIRTVYSEGPSSQRPLKISIGKGDFSIDQANDIITWKFTSSFQASQLNEEVNEDNLIIKTIQAGVKDQYETELKLDYDTKLDIVYIGTLSTLSGTHKLLITNIGSPAAGALTQIKISEL